MTWKLRGEIWLQAWLSIIENEFCRSAEEASFWADQCLKDYDARFGYQGTTPCQSDTPNCNGYRFDKINIVEE